MSKKEYNSPTACIVRGFELLQSTPIYTSGSLNGDNEDEVLGKENDILYEDEEDDGEKQSDIINPVDF